MSVSLASLRGKASGRSDREVRSSEQTGANLTLSSDLVANVRDVAGRAGTDPRTLVQAAVSDATGVDPERVRVSPLSHDGATGRVSVPASAVQVAAAAVDGEDMGVRNLIRGAVAARANREREAATAQQGGGYLPMADPLGVVEAATGGAVRDPLRVALFGGGASR